MQIAQINIIDEACRNMNTQERARICVPQVQAYILHDFGTKRLAKHSAATHSVSVIRHNSMAQDGGDEDEEETAAAIGASKPAEELLVGCVFQEMPALMPLRTIAEMAPPEQTRGWVQQVCHTVEWLFDRRIGWGGSALCSDGEKGLALLDATVVDAFGRPWLFEGFTKPAAWTLHSDRVAIEELRRIYSLPGTLQPL